MVKRFSGLLSLVFFLAVPASAQESLTVVELFTSQGCELCPPADKILEKISRMDDVLALSLPVDYWDYMGWKDTYGSENNTARQEAYNQRLGRRGVYTPQMIVNGVYDVVGSREEEVAAVLDQARQNSGGSIAAALKGTRDHLVLELGESELARNAVLRFVWYDSEQKVAIKKGDNSGRSLRYINVVRGAKIIGEWEGAALTMPLDLNALDESGANCAAVIIQDGPDGRILGAAKIIFSN